MEHLLGLTGHRGSAVFCRNHYFELMIPLGVIFSSRWRVILSRIRTRRTCAHPHSAENAEAVFPSFQPKHRKPARLEIVLPRDRRVGSSPGVSATPPRTPCGSRRFFKNHLLLILSRFLRKSRPTQQKREKWPKNAGLRQEGAL